MGRIEQVLDAIGPLISAALNENNLPGIPCAVGWPVATDLADVLAQGGSQITIFPHAGGRRVKLRKYAARNYNIAPITLTATASGPILTIGGTVTAGENVFVYVDQGVASYTVQSTDTLNSIASALGTSIRALSGTSATVSGASITVGGTSSLSSTVAGTATSSSEVSRWEQRLQISVWSPTPEIRAPITDAIISNVGTDMNPFIDLGDGTTAYMRLASPPQRDDKSQLWNNVYIDHIFYTVEYGILQTAPMYGVGNVTSIINAPGGVSVAISSGDSQ